MTAARDGRLTPEEVRARIDAELRQSGAGDEPPGNLHGLQLSRCLLARPERRTYLDSFAADRPDRKSVV